MSKTALIDKAFPPSEVIKRAERIGAEIRNIKLSDDLPDQTIIAINGLLLEHKVLFFATRIILMTPSRSGLLSAGGILCRPR
ncbi:hypothetical protein ABIF90_007182 [Bradyrhizobium japonicum]